MKNASTLAVEALPQILREFADAWDASDEQLIERLDRDIAAAIRQMPRDVILDKRVKDEVNDVLRLLAAGPKVRSVGLEGPVRTAPGSINYIKAGVASNHNEAHTDFAGQIRVRARRVERILKAFTQGAEMQGERQLPTPARRVGEQYRAAIEAKPELASATDEGVYEYFRDNLHDPFEDDSLHSVETWTRHLRTYRSKTGQPKNTPRRSRGHGKSIVRQDDI